MNRLANLPNKINHAVEYARLIRDFGKKKESKSDKYSVMVNDENGKEYIIQYYF